MTAEVTGEIETEDGVLVIRKIHVTYRIAATEENRETIERVHEMHREHCPVYRSIYRSIEVTTDYEIVDRS